MYIVPVHEETNTFIKSYRTPVHLDLFSFFSFYAKRIKNKIIDHTLHSHESMRRLLSRRFHMSSAHLLSATKIKRHDVLLQPHAVAVAVLDSVAAVPLKIHFQRKLTYSYRYTNNIKNNIEWSMTGICRRIIADVLLVEHAKEHKYNKNIIDSVDNDNWICLCWIHQTHT